jgi:hypothetical protein
MALVSAVRASKSQRALGLNPLRAEHAHSVLWAAFLTLVIAGPWLLPGYLFGTDWPGHRRIPFPTGLSSSAPLQAALSLASSAIGGEATGKFLFLAILFTAAVSAYRAVPAGGFVPKAVAASIYVANPFVYGRLHYGQVFLLAGYAILPWVATRFRLLLDEPRVITAILAAISVTLLGILSLHLFFEAAILIGTLAIAQIISRLKTPGNSTRLAASMLLTAFATLVASAYWIVPLLSGRGSEGLTVARITVGDVAAFAAVPDRSFGLLPNLLGLYGFWAEATGRFDSMKAFVPAWPVVLSLLLILCSVGALAAFWRHDKTMRPWVAGLVGAAAVALILEMGVSHPLTSGLVRWLDANFYPYKGLRDAGKWAALLALGYSQLAALGVVAIFEWVNKYAPPRLRSEWVASTLAGLLLVLPLYYGNGLLYGAHGEIKPSQYPAGWYTADRVLASDAHPGRTLFLPWHDYMSYSFIQNQNSVVASPAPTFFSVPILASANPEVPGIVPPASADQVAVAALVKEGSQGRWAEVLAALNVKYVLVAKEVDWKSYAYLDSQQGITRVADFGQILLFRNNLVSPLRSLNQTTLYVKLTVRPRDG